MLRRIRTAWRSEAVVTPSSTAPRVARRPASLALFPHMVAVAAFLICAAATIEPARAQGDPLAAPRYIDVPDKQVYGLATADFDGQTGPDLAVVSYFGDNLAILLNNGSGHFCEPTVYAAGDGTISVVAEDFDGDGICDLATIGRRDDKLRLFWGQGDGSFIAGAIYSTGDEPIQLVAAEINGQSGIDLACSNLSGIAPTFSVYLNDGSGSFSHADYPSDAGQRGIAAADLNGDGYADLGLALYAAGQIAVHFNDGNGFFGPALTLTTMPKPYSLAAQDLDNNTTVDLVIIHKDDANSIWAIPGLGNGTFGLPLTWNAPEIMDCLLLVDLDDDEDCDLLVTSSLSNQVGILYQPNNNDWQDPEFFTGGEGAYASVAADFDGDGDNDIVVSSYWTARLAYLQNHTHWVPVFVDFFRSEVLPGRVRLDWRGGGDTGPAEFRVLVGRDDPRESERLLRAEEIEPDIWRAFDDAAELLAGGRFLYTLQGWEGGDWRSLWTESVELTAGLGGSGLLVTRSASDESFRIVFDLAQAGLVALSVHDPSGRRVATLAGGAHAVGIHEYSWHGCDESGRRQAAGVYLLSLRGEDGLAESRTILLLK